jgi:hypothetical protein
MVVENKVQLPPVEMSPEFKAKLEAHRARVVELRKEIGDPEEALSRLVREVFTLDVLLSGIRLSEDGEWLGFREDDEDDD